ncbi:MAG: tRNA dihydrouridine synthase DusB [Sporichthyaceae bacterium]
MLSLALGGHRLDPPVVLAPMAGITNRAYRKLCREHAPGGLYVNEMVTARGLVEGDRTTRSMVAFDVEERPRSLQLYGTDAESIGAAARLVVEEDLADHIDLNFGCPVPKVTRKGGGAALPYKRALFGRVVAAAVAGADGRAPVTVKMRIGIDEQHLTYLDAGRIAAQEGVAWVALHARTATQHYSGQADWSAIARLVEHLAPFGTPVLGNGDIWEAADAVAMMAATGCAGVVVGRGCLGRPWLFANLAAVLAGEPDPGHPDLGVVAATMRRHAHLMAEDGGERWACCEIRKHIAWYLKGFAVGSDLRRSLALVESLAEFDDLLGRLDLAQTFPDQAVGSPRGRTGSPRRVALPDGWLADDWDGEVAPDRAGDLAVSGG